MLLHIYNSRNTSRVSKTKAHNYDEDSGDESSSAIPAKYVFSPETLKVQMASSWVQSHCLMYRIARLPPKARRLHR